ncbi:hypothetical protein PVAG01_04312 [Phlyctema vagabunda]|uniref:Uncharacterized protein n=1 Tax=Phlyctema vagabunda TaxID=108571 RepID=A0ABR4PQ72_9HELO
MDEASKLVTDLQTRLQELDRKVWLYRRDMASEFTKYTEDLLRNVPQDISEKVSKAIATSMKDCEALHPGFSDLLDSSAPGTDANGTQKSTPLNLQTSTVVKAAAARREDKNDNDESEVPRSPHEREKEFRGLFTPSYLPLLESTNRNERRWGDEISSVSVTDKAKGKQIENMSVDVGTNTSRSLAATPEPLRPTTPKRRNTDEVSIASTGSDGPIRRSALRRTASSPKVHSPRRVRFEVAGEEVLPTVSPVNDSILSPDAGSEYSSFGDSDDECGSEQVENIEDLPPKRISSSQALRALSRGPLEDDGTKWTVVSAPPDGSPSIPIENGQSRGSSTDDLHTTNEGLQRIPELPEVPESFVQPPSSNGSKTKNSTVAEIEIQDQVAEDSSEDEGLDMKSRRPAKKQPAVLNNATTSRESNGETRTDAIIVPTADQNTGHMTGSIDNSSSQDYLKFQDDDDVLFQFDEHAGEERRPIVANEDDAESDADADATASEQVPLNLSQYSRSPARSILWPATSTPKGSIQPQSWKGHPFSEPVVNPELHDKVASLGAVHSFVGSVDGRTGLDESDMMQSFRESLKYGSTGSFSGTPRSMSERMMLEDLMEAEEGKTE